MNRKQKNITWLMIAGYLLWVLIANIFHPAPLAVSAAINIVLLISIVTCHALARYTLRQYLIFAAITFVVSNIYENLSILTGFPFGHYHYTDGLGPKLFLVPVIIAPAYFAAGYLAWALAHVLLGVFCNKLRGQSVWSVPLIAAFVMVMWDLPMDPIVATIRKQWLWHDGGSYFGVPFVNFMGWLLCVYTIFQIFAVYISRKQEDAINATDRSYWYQPGVAFVILSLSFVIPALTGGQSVVTDPAGHQWQTRDIFESMALVAIFTMWFTALLSVILAAKHRQAD